MPAVMVVDDDDIVRRFVVRILEREGGDVVAFADAAEALSTPLLTDADLIITDLTMPTSGEVFIRELRRREIRTPVLVMSGHLSEEKAHYLIILGAQAFIRKPFDLEEFRSIVRSLV